MGTVRGEESRKLLSRLHASREWSSDRRVGADTKQARRGQPEYATTCESPGAQDRTRRAKPGAERCDDRRVHGARRIWATSTPPGPSVAR
jgi:hypothetical protein